MKFLNCVFYLMAVGVIGFFAGRGIPKSWLKPNKGIFRCRLYENEGKLYERIGIKKWQKKVPDMSRILPFMMPPKNLQGDYQSRLSVMILETCKAELTHVVLCVIGLPVLKLIPGKGGMIVYLLYVVVFNLPYILIQRYNRPRLIRLYEKQKQKECIMA